ncbi:MAG TPA: DegT/DnrJ/EryC1/StrS family aminotransferase [Cellvibrio sp.]|nr:DegT/DnrJ/EryC1/StrS family aminotransferase [Cellvibrio sp.]
MEAIRSLIRGDLPPVGRKIIFSNAGCDKDLPEFEGYYSCWVDSGTSALALAFLRAKSLWSGGGTPEVILPGYCCPDLVAAAHYAGLLPRVVDINEDDPSLNLAAVCKCISKNTVAIVAVNFLGVAENLSELLELKIEYPQLSIIEDNAQWFPADGQDAFLRGDFVTFSFGRGKPLSLLGGGLLLSRYPFSMDFVAKHVESSGGTNSSRLLTAFKYIAYNQLLSPFFYQLLSKNPFITLGKTKYSRLNLIAVLDAHRSELLAPNLRAYYQSVTPIAEEYDSLFQTVGFENKFKGLGSARRQRLLRYPVLFASVEQKQKVLAKLLSLGLGATEMYRTELTLVDGVEDISVCGSLENAISFASRFITLPTHAGVTKSHLQLIQKAFQS